MRVQESLELERLPKWLHLLYVRCLKMAAVEQDVKIHTETLVTSRTEIKELKSTLQRLQIELQSHLSMV